MPEQGHLCRITVLEEEYVSLHGPLPSSYNQSEEDPEKRLADLYKHIRERKRSALCISGGGIRSASFGLGVLQGLARYDLLDRFDYLSTVSGGGYLGSWLSAWIDRHYEGLEGVAKDLASKPPRPPIDPEPEPIRNLRKYSNYLSPRLGLLSADSWTLAATVVRNLILIWLVLIPILAAVLMLPRICVAAIKWDSGAPLAGLVPTFIFGLGVVATVFAVAYIGINRPSVSKSNHRQGRFLLWCWGPLLLSAILLTTYWAWLRQPEDKGMRHAMALDLEVRTAQANKDAEQKTQSEKLAIGTYALTISKEGVEAGSPATAQTQQQTDEQRAEEERRDKELAAKAECLESFLKDGSVVKSYDVFVAECLQGKLQKPPTTEEKVTIEQRFAQRMEAQLTRISVFGLKASSSFLLFLILGTVLNLSGWLVSAAWLKRLKFGEAILAAITGAAGGWLSWLVATKMFPYPTSHAEFYAAFAAPLFLVVFLLSVTLLAGLSSRRTSDDADREWWARLGAWGLIAAVCWVVISCLVILGPPMLAKLPGWLASLGGISGLITLLMGHSSKTSAKEAQEKRTLPSIIADNVMLFATGVFAGFLIVIVSSLTSLLVWWLASKLSLDVNWHFSPKSEFAFFPSDGPFGDLKIILHAPFGFVLIIAICLAGLSLLMALLINTNKFSLHAMYRNRLIRAYLGASRSEGERKPNRFTGFDEDDNIPMHSLWPAKRDTSPGNSNRTKLLHVINMALNLVQGGDLAWQQRKAESFTSSPLHSGNYRLGYRRSKEYGGKDGISLGTAVTISGAAASPNMGYHSSPFVAFLLTLFNGRLGAWLGNPGPPGQNTYHRSSPRLSLIPIVKEAFGLTNDSAGYVYLSDGGHFENLALYEMVLRRCHIIVVSDGSQDAGCNFEDLGGAVRKIRIDQGIPIEFEHEITIFGRSDEISQNERGKYCAVGRIQYSHVDGTDPKDDGYLVYIKPSFYGKEPRDIYQYAKSNLLFPHESTADQFFSESQFESYRMLGKHAVETICQEWPKIPPGDLVSFALHAEKFVSDKHGPQTRLRPNRGTRFNRISMGSRSDLM